MWGSNSRNFWHGKVETDMSFLSTQSIEDVHYVSFNEAYKQIIHGLCLQFHGIFQNKKCIVAPAPPHDAATYITHIGMGNMVCSKCCCGVNPDANKSITTQDIVGGVPHLCIHTYIVFHYTGINSAWQVFNPLHLRQLSGCLQPSLSAAALPGLVSS